jgi:hypothetical protein
MAIVRRPVVGLLLAATAVLALAALTVGPPRQARFDANIRDASACTALGGQWGHFHLPRPGESPICLLPATDGGQRCLSTTHCRSSVCRPDPAASASTGFQVGRCDGLSWDGDCGDVVRNGFPRHVDCPVE